MAMLLGKKIGMTQIYDESGKMTPVTVIQAGPCTVMQVKTPDTDGYNALQLGLDDIKASRVKIFVFLFTVIVIVLVIGTLMYLIEGEESGFTSIPAGIYWAIVTLTTVGYGDITPVTLLGKSIASLVMVIGYGIIAVPTGIVTFEIASAVKHQKEMRVCDHCGHHQHDADANYCKSCGEKL